MPLYEYECRQCHRRTEKIQKYSDVEITVCPFCAGELERTITAPSFQFSGGGWYKDGYGSVKPPAASSGESTSDAAPAAPAGASGAAESSAAPAKPKPPASAPATSVSAASAPAAPASASSTKS